MLLQINYQAQDELLKHYPKIEKCLKCSLCAFRDGYGCYISNYGIGTDGTRFNALDTYTYNIFDQKEPEKNSNLWLCVSCHRCHEICPYDVNPMEVIEALKAIAFEKGYAPELIRAEIKNVISTSFAFPITKSQQVLRSKLDLPPLESAGLDELNKIVKRTNLEQKLAMK